MSKDYNSVVIKLKNANAKKAYATEYVSIAKDIAAVFSDAKYSSDYMLPSHMASLKKEIKTYKEFRKEIVSLNGSKINPFLIPAEEITSVENDIIDLQKTVTVSIRKALESYDTSDFKETGKMTINAESSFGKIDMTIEKYTRILSLLTKSQEADIVAKAKFTLNMPGSYEYDEETGDYTKTK